MKKHPIIVIKLGTSSIVDETTHQPLLSILALIVETAIKLRKDGYKVVIVSSGAIGVGLQRMDLPRRPKHLPQVQALAAIGQCRLIGLWAELFERLSQPIAQILITRNDIADRTQYLNAQNTISELLLMGVIPIVNENDTLAVTEIKFGDNDTLSAITAGMIQADYLFLMTDVDCLYHSNPRKNPDAKPVEVVEDIASLSVDISSPGSSLGTGGMSTKIVAARLATAAGVTTIITKSSSPGNIVKIVRHIEALKAAQRNSVTGALENNTIEPKQPPTTHLNNLTLSPSPPPPHTRFLPSSHPIRDRHFWVLHGLAPHGTLYIDSGAAHALSEKAGLLPVGIVEVDGAFAQQECVRLVEVKRRLPRPRSTLPTPLASTPTSTSTPTSGTTTPTSTMSVALEMVIDPAYPPREIGRAVVNYAATEIRRIKGLRSTEIVGVLGYADSEYVALRENVALLGSKTGVSGADRESRPSTPVKGVSGGLGGYV